METIKIMYYIKCRHKNLNGEKYKKRKNRKYHILSKNTTLKPNNSARELRMKKNQFAKTQSKVLKPSVKSPLGKASKVKIQRIWEGCRRINIKKKQPS